MKKRFAVFCVSLIFITLLSVLVSAQYGYFDLRSASEQIINWIQDIFGPFFAVFLGGTGEFLFEKILFFFIVLTFSFVVLKKFPVFEDHLGALWVTVAAVAILSTRFLTESEVVASILLPYSVLGVALTAAIPIVIFFLFVHTFDSSTLRKVLWIFFIVVFWGLYGSRAGELGSLAFIYLLTGIVALIFLFADGTIRRTLINQQMKELGHTSRMRYESDVRRQLHDVETDHINGIITDSQYMYMKRKLQKKLKDIRKN